MTDIPKAGDVGVTGCKCIDLTGGFRAMESAMVELRGNFVERLSKLEERNREEVEGRRKSQEDISAKLEDLSGIRRKLTRKWKSLSLEK